MEDNFSYTEHDISRMSRLTTHGKKGSHRRKGDEQRETFGEVFDKRTLETLYRLTKKRIIYKLDGAIGSGKESKIFHGEDYDSKEIAVKIFLTATAEFKKRLPYVVGDRRFEDMKHTGYELIRLWAKKEYVNLRTAHQNGINVPNPVIVLNNVLVMEFIGVDGRKAPLLANVKPNKSDYLKVIKMIRKLYIKAKLVHADLSEHNIFKLGGKIYFFDFGSAVDISHPKAVDFLKRDIKNINGFFVRNKIEVFDEKRILRGVNKG
jgi:RIO kinase 1